MTKNARNRLEGTFIGQANGYVSIRGEWLIWEVLAILFAILLLGIVFEGLRGKKFPNFDSMLFPFSND